MTPEQEKIIARIAAGTHVCVPVEPTYSITAARFNWANYQPVSGWSPTGKRGYGEYCAMIQAAQEEQQ